jgi:hypothetical protein
MLCTWLGMLLLLLPKASAQCLLPLLLLTRSSRVALCRHGKVHARLACLPLPASKQYMNNNDQHSSCTAMQTRGRLFC